MTKVLAGMTSSLDGFVSDTDGNIGALYSDFETLQESDYMRLLTEETGAVLMGRRTFDMTSDPDAYAEDYEFQVPIFVLTHHPPAVAPKENDRLSITFVTDGVESAVRQAIAAAGSSNVTVVGGVDLIHQLLLAGLVDELHLDIMPILLGDGLRFLDTPRLDGIQLEKICVQEIGARTAMRFRVVPAA